MACSSCSRNSNRRSNNWGCRKAVQNARWPSCNGCDNCGSYCTSCGNCGCSNTCTSCGSTTVCSGRNTAYAQPYDGSRFGGNRWRRDWDSGCSGRRSGCYDGYEDRNFPFYSGPCGPVNPVCGCTGGCSNGCADGCSSCECREAVFGFFTQVGTLDVNAGGIVPFNGGSTVEGIWKDGGELTLDAAGVYMVTLSAAIPSNVALYTELDVRVNGVSNPGGRLILDKDCAGAPLMANTQTVITVNEGAVVTVTSTEAISLSANNDSDPIVTLSIVKIS